VGLIIHVDGGARGNPGPAGAGVVIHDDQQGLIFEAAYFLGRQTSNAAEYHALIRALERAGHRGRQPIQVYSDSELLVRQLTGEYQVKSPNLAPLYRQVQMLLIKTARWTVRHVPREQNERADELANVAMDRRRNVVVFDAEDQTAGAPETAVAASEGTRERPAPAKPADTIAGPAGRPAVRVRVSRAPAGGVCPAGDLAEEAFTVVAALPVGLCVHAAHALVPTLLAILNTDPEEFAAVPTLTVRCGRPGCGAEFQLSPVRSSNGAPRQGGR